MRESKKKAKMKKGLRSKYENHLEQQQEPPDDEPELELLHDDEASQKSPTLAVTPNWSALTCEVNSDGLKDADRASDREGL